MRMRLWFLILIPAILLGCTQSETGSDGKSELEKRYGELENSYRALQERHALLNSEYSALNLSFNYLYLNYYEANLSNKRLRTDYEKLNSSHARLISAYIDLNDSHNNLDSLYRNLSARYSKLEDDYRELQATGSQYRLPKDIPASPSIPNIGFLITPDSLILKNPRLNLSSVTDTKSMHPTITVENTAIFTTVFDAANLKIGNIIAYRSSSFELPIMHRIISIQRSSGGVCYVLQGDNNPAPDPECVTPSQIIGLVIGVIFNGENTGYSYCQGDSIAIVKNNRFLCMPDVVPAGIYTTNQTITQDNLTGFPFCSQQDPARPYTVVTPDRRVYCYESVS